MLSSPNPPCAALSGPLSVAGYHHPGNGPLVLVLAVAALAGAYLWDCWRYPHLPCRWCGGREKQRPKGRRVYRVCRRHRERVRAGAWIMRPGLRHGEGKK